MPLGQFDDDLTEHVHHAFVAIARLKPGISLPQAQDEMGRLNQQEAIAYPAAHKGFGVRVHKLQDRVISAHAFLVLVIKFPTSTGGRSGAQGLESADLSGEDRSPAAVRRPD
jgi:hypothetical protein